MRVRTIGFLLLLAFAGVVLAQGKVGHVNALEAFSGSVFIPCAAGGSGEVVDFSGSNRLVSTVSTNPVGHSRVKVRSQLQELSGIGQLTGDAYRVLAPQQNAFSVVAFDEEGASVEGLPNLTSVSTYGLASGVRLAFSTDFRVLDSVTGIDSSVHATLYFVVEPTGVVVVKLDNASAVCG